MAQSSSHIGIENKIVAIVRKLKTKYPELGRYEMSFHLDRYSTLEEEKRTGENLAFYDRVLETIEDARGFRARFTDKSSIDIPIEAINDYENPNFVEKWGEIIMATRRV
ncbi:MAG: hypothetical protein NZM06_11830 [Chloroherpetonaceae bacterium]|nr:hypothetical protein [Chloroherpetonaceae bacterium]MDW8437987.1 hypothetical protein [Chloroherpetonaceae bacterium]